MPQSFGVYGEQKKGVQPWAQIITLFPGAQNVSNFFSLYDSLGDVTLVGNNTVPTILDGPEKVVRYGNLTVGDGTTATSLTASNRCKGLTILCDSLTVKNNASVNMTARGARVDRNDDPFFPFIDFKIPFQVVLSSDSVSISRALQLIKDNGLAPWDQGTWQSIIAALYGFNLAITQPGSAVLLSATGCGASKLGGAGYNISVAGLAGNAGVDGGAGGGGTGGYHCNGTQYCTVFKSGGGTPYAGGSASGGVIGAYVGCSTSSYSGPGGNGGGNAPGSTATFWPGDLTATIAVGGGGAGNGPGKKGSHANDVDGGNGTGGKLVIICRGTITVQSGGKIEANGMPGGNCNVNPGAAGGGSGGGNISLISPSAVSNAGTIQCAGGAAGTGYPNGGAGGAGNVNGAPVTKTFTEMGW